MVLNSPIFKKKKKKLNIGGGGSNCSDFSEATEWGGNMTFLLSKCGELPFILC